MLENLLLCGFVAFFCGRVLIDIIAIYLQCLDDVLERLVSSPKHLLDMPTDLLERPLVQGSC